MLHTPPNFIASHRPHPDADSLTFVFCAGQLLLREDDMELPDARYALPLHGIAAQQLHPLGEWAGQHCTTAWLAPDTPIQPGHTLMPLRALFGVKDGAWLGLASRAAQVAEWARTHRFCGHCGTPTVLTPGERAYTCPACGHSTYPRISPAMMVLVRRGADLLLARHVRSPNGVFSALAGFLEAGESVEDAIHREVAEEVGLKVKDLRYFGSQSWPFPHSLMIAFTAEYAGGDVTVDGDEIAEARWFGPHDALPAAPSQVSIAAQLIRANRG